MAEAVFVGDIVQVNGKTWKENNLAMKHEIPIGTLVEINCDHHPEHKTRQFVAAHGRDCDGEPLYTLTTKRNLCEDQIHTDGYGKARNPLSLNQYRAVYQHGSWGKESLIVIES